MSRQFEFEEDEKCTECSICCSNFTRLNKQVSCCFCLFVCCTTCVKRRVLDSSECMNCKKVWNLDFIQDNTPKSWFDGEYKEKRKTDLLDREKSLLQTAIPIMKIKSTEKRYDDKIRRLRDEMRRLDRELSTTLYEKTYNLERIRNGYEEETEEKMEEILDDEKREELRRLKRDEKAQFIKPCPVNNCRGFLSTRWKCGVCETCVCKDCLMIKREEHTCKQEDVDTATFIKKDSRPCPKCGAGIHRIDGCNAMFCVQCNTCFDYKTGKIQTSNSNPHFAAWKRTNESTAQNNNTTPANEINGCGGNNYNTTRSIDTIQRLFRNRFKGLKVDISQGDIYSIENFLHHFNQEVLPYYNVGLDNLDKKWMEFRIMYLEHRIDDETWKRNILTREKKCLYNQSMTHLAQMFLDVLYDIILRLASVEAVILHTNNIPNGNKDTRETNQKILDEFVTIFKEVEALIQYFNEESDKIARRYNYSQRHQIRVVWNHLWLNKQTYSISDNQRRRQMKTGRGDMNNSVGIYIRKVKFEKKPRVKKENSASSTVRIEDESSSSEEGEYELDEE